jgi:hypothetical protein
MPRVEETTTKRENTAILRCSGPNCRNAYQDERCGKGMRVHNRTKQNKQTPEQRWRCTVCKDEKPA